MIDLIANTKPGGWPSRSITAIPLCRPCQRIGRTHDGAVLAALAVSFGTMSVCRSTHRRPIGSSVVSIGLVAAGVGSLVQRADNAAARGAPLAGELAAITLTSLGNGCGNTRPALVTPPLRC